MPPGDHLFLESLIAGLKALCATFPDRRRGENTIYEMADIGMAAFSTFFMQSPSFLAHQTALERGRGTSNCQTLFAMDKIPTDNHIRSMLDPVPPETLLPMFGETLAALEAGGGLGAFQRLGGHVLIALDGTEYFCSQKLSCRNCSSRARANGRDRVFPRHGVGRDGGTRARACAAAGAGVHRPAGRCREAGLRGPRHASLAGGARRQSTRA